MVVRDAKRAAILFLTYTPPFLRRGSDRSDWSDLSDMSDRSDPSDQSDRALSGDCGPGNEKEKTSVSKSSLGG